jgi:hypothetical protein
LAPVVVGVNVNAIVQVEPIAMGDPEMQLSVEMANCVPVVSATADTVRVAEPLFVMTTFCVPLVVVMG